VLKSAADPCIELFGEERYVDAPLLQPGRLFSLNEHGNLKMAGLNLSRVFILLLSSFQLSWSYSAFAVEPNRDGFARLRATEQWQPESTIPVEPQLARRPP